MSDKSPDAFRTISEVADWLGVQPHVLRFWESKFSQVRPVKRAGGRRYYRPNDMLLLGGIRKLLHEDGLTIKGAQKVLREEGMSHVARLSQPLDAESAALSDIEAGFEEEADFGAPSEPEEKPRREVEDEPQLAPVPDHPPEADPTLERPPELAPVPEPPPADRLAPPAPSTEAPSREKAEGAAPEAKPIPSFMRSSAARKPTPREAADGPREAKEPSSGRLPSFLQPAPSGSATAPRQGKEPEEPREAELPLSFPEPSGDTDAEPAAAPRPRVVDAPDPDESTFEVASGALSAAFAATRIPPNRRAELLPLVAQLAALRDRMAAGRDR